MSAPEAAPMHDPLGILAHFEHGADRTGRLYSLPALERKGPCRILEEPL
jgi:hypothetical protein